jgi:multiple sugar transport system substrate-binding protein
MGDRHRAGWGLGAPRRALRVRRWGILLCAVVIGCSAGRSNDGERVVITISGSMLGTEGELLRRQVSHFEAAHPGVTVRVQPAPDDATQRHQLYVQWLNAHAGDPDVLQLDVIWTPEFAAAGWILPLDRFEPEREAFFPATIRANEWAGRLYALPWYVDVGLLYWRTDLVDHEPATLDELVTSARRAMDRPNGPRYGFVWQGARYEGLVTVFQEYLGAFGGRMATDDGRVVVDSPAGVRALQLMIAELYTSRITPPEVLTWHEEEARFAFQNGMAVFMRNWPYAYALLQDSSRSRVSGRFSVTTMPAAPGGTPTATLGGSELAINAYTEHPAVAYALIDYLTRPAQMLERAEVVGEYPARMAVYDDPRLARAVPVPVAQIRRAIERATPRPVIPIYTQLSELLQIQLHRALTRQVSAAVALRTAARQMNALIERTRIRDLMAAGRREGIEPEVAR